MVDYPRQARLKLLGRTEVFEGEQARDWIARLRDPNERTPIERVFLIRIEAFDWNCPQHITPRFTEEEIKEALAPLERRMQELEQENRRLRQELTQARAK
jgi:hypothetical protein